MALAIPAGGWSSARLVSTDLRAKTHGYSSARGAPPVRKRPDSVETGPSGRSGGPLGRSGSPGGGPRPLGDLPRRARVPPSPAESAARGLPEYASKRYLGGAFTVGSPSLGPREKSDEVTASRVESSYCRLCSRPFGSGRALTQHRRFVHEGARLFGYSLIPPEPADTSAQDDGGVESQGLGEVESGSGERRDEESSDSDMPVDPLVLLLALAALGVAAYLRTRSNSSPPPRGLGPWAAPLPFSPYGPKPTPWPPER
jgi:hypothetical protein